MIIVTKRSWVHTLARAKISYKCDEQLRVFSPGKLFQAPHQTRLEKLVMDKHELIWAISSK
jgi:hypothetical protein